MRMKAIVLAALLPAACSTRPGEPGSATGYRGIEELRILVKGME